MRRMPHRTKCQSDVLNKVTNGKSNYISLKEVQELLFLHESSIRYQIIKQRFRAFKSKGRWFINRDDVNAYKLSKEHGRGIES